MPMTHKYMRIENCIKDISSWMMHNSLQINENKTEFIIFNTTPHKLKKHTLQVGTNNNKFLYSHILVRHQ